MLNPGNLTMNNNDSQRYEQNWQAVYSFWVDGVVTLALVVVGVAGNVAMVVSLVCTTKSWLPLYYYFLTFSLWNTALLASTVFFYCLPSLDERIGAKNAEFTYLNVLGYPLANAGMTAAIWLVLSVTVERCIVVSRPLDQIVSEPKRRAKFVTAAISILAPVFNLPLFFELTVINNGTDLAKSALRDDQAYKIGYRIIGNMLFLSVVPFLSIIAMSIRIIYVVQHAMASSHHQRNSTQKQRSRSKSSIRRTRNGSRTLLGAGKEGAAAAGGEDHSAPQSPNSRCHSSSQKNAYATHVTLAVLATKFVLCYTLPTVLNILEIIVEPSTLQQEGLSFLVDVSNLMVVADSAFNAFVYMSWRRKIQVQQTRSRRKQRSRMSVTSSSNAYGTSLKSRNGSSCNNGVSPQYNRLTSTNPTPDHQPKKEAVDEYAL